MTEKATPVAAGETAAAGVEAIVAESTGYELLKRRLADQGAALATKVQTLNAARVAEFGRSELALAARTRARTENNCVARDIVRIGDVLVFGYNVFIGLRKETKVADVFGLYKLAGGGTAGDGLDELVAQPLAGTFLDDPRFAADFRELYAYYKQTSLTQLRINQHRLLAAFRIGEQVGDIRVFRWSIETDGSVRYIDNRGERDIALPPAQDFEWTPTTRDEHVAGRHPHINILDQVFVDTVGGDLTVKIEDNTESGLGVYSEPVEDATQALADAEVAYARLGSLTLLRVKPYRESASRYLVFNTRTQTVLRIDAIGDSCVQLPEDHGIIFPGGYYLQSGESKTFDLPAEATAGMRFKRMVRSPNGEDVLYVFYDPASGNYGLFSYNLIEKRLGVPILSNGYARFDDGRILVFQAESKEPTRLHPMQLWATPFASEEHATRAKASGTFLGRIGNAELVRGISELASITRAVREQTPTRNAYRDLIRQCERAVDAFFWLDSDDAGKMAADLRTIANAAKLTLDEFDKVDAIRRDAAKALREAEAAQHRLLTDVASKLWQSPADFVAALADMQAQRGRLLALKDQRYIDVARLGAMDAAIAAEQAKVGERATGFLADAKSFDLYRAELAAAAEGLGAAATTGAIAKILDSLDALTRGLDLLTEQLGVLAGGDATVRTQILDNISRLYAEANKLRAESRAKRKTLSLAEGRAEFGAQFKLFAQAVENALDFADTPEKCDDGLTRLLAQLEDLEGRFGEDDAFVADIAAKRETVYEAFAGKKQMLVESRQRRGRTLIDAAKRILDGIPKRIAQFAQLEQVHGYFASDPLVGKVRTIAGELRALDSAVQADDLDTQLKTARDQAIRAVRDKQELVSASDNTIRFGRHSFTVARQALDLTLVPREGQLHYHLTGTDYFAPVEDARLAPLAGFWDQELVSETRELYRAEYLAGRFIEAVAEGEAGIDLPTLEEWATLGDERHGQLVEGLRQFAAVRYQEGYQKGVHDEDAARIVSSVVTLQSAAGMLKFGAAERALALLFWVYGLDEPERAAWVRRARAAEQLRTLFAAGSSRDRLIGHLHDSLTAVDARFKVLAPGPSHAPAVRRAAKYLLAELGAPRGGESWVVAGAAADLADRFVRHLERAGQLAELRAGFDAVAPEEGWQHARDWLSAFVEADNASDARWIDDAATVIALPLNRARVNATVDATIVGLLGEHPRIDAGKMTIALKDFWRRYYDHVEVNVAGFEALQNLRRELVEVERGKLAIGQFQAKPLASFVRNKLIDEVYLPLVGDNLAKQIGAAGEANRTDRMGMLLLISPPGYGKTTLMEYVADRLGMIFVRINCPVLGHGVNALDPAQAGNSAARKELEKLNLGLAMGANVMLYLDDIQHTSAEFLQKFIALADGTRRIEGIWRGEPRTYDMRGKRFAIVMAGNPYTESGEVFKIPDMLANRADIYNLGDVLSGREGLFARSYIENSLTANPALAPLATRDPRDVDRLLRLAEGESVPSTDFAHAYSAAELNELTHLTQRLFRVRDVLLKVNLAYIESAAQDDDYRTEPPFKLQGSYRNMAKLAAKVTAVMDLPEIDALMRDHYRGEAQTLTSGAEENLLKLAEILDSQTAQEKRRWQTIKDGFVRQKKLGGDETDPATRIAGTLLDISRALDELRTEARTDSGLMRIAEHYEKVLAPLVSATYHKLRMDHAIWSDVTRISEFIKRIQAAPLTATVTDKRAAAKPEVQPRKPPGED